MYNFCDKKYPPSSGGGTYSAFLNSWEDHPEIFASHCCVIRFTIGSCLLLNFDYSYLL